MGYTEQQQQEAFDKLGRVMYGIDRYPDEVNERHVKAVNELDRRRQEFELYKNEIKNMERQCKEDVHAAIQQTENKVKARYMPFVEALVTLVEVLDTDQYVDIQGNMPRELEKYKKAKRLIRKGVPANEY